MAGSFTLDVRRFVAKAKANAHAVASKVVADVAERLVELSPVGNPELWAHPAPKGYVGGRFRANWQIGIGAPVLSELYGENDASFPDQQEVADGIVAQIPVDAAGRRYFITNSLAYAMPLEQGWSKQAPAGMVAITVVEFQQFVARAVGSL